MRGTRTDRSNKYTPVPQAVSDEDEGVYEESPESSQQTDLASTDCIPADANSVVFPDDFRQPDLQPLEFCSRNSHQGSRTPHPLAFIEAESPSKSPKMSLSRQVCFLLSISVCLTYMVALLWLIPCHMAPCIVKNSHRTLPLQLKEWSNTFPSICFVSKPQLVKLWESQTIILLAFQPMEHNTSTLDKKTKDVVGGVIALRGQDGKEAWRCPFYTAVLDVICHTDVNNDGIVDCAVLGSTGLLATVNASNGHTFWYLHDHDAHSAQINAISSPCTLTDMDFDRDGVDDFVVIGVTTYDGFRNAAETTVISPWQINDEQVAHVGLLLVSGSNGQIIGQSLPLPDMLAPCSSTGYRKIPNLLVYNLGNNTKSLLLLLGSGDGSRINQQNNPETVLTISIEDLYAGVTKDRKAEDTYKAEFRNVYSAKENIQSVTIMKNEESKASDVLLLTNNNEELICLDGANDLRLKWKYKKEKSKISQPVLGRFNVDGIMDIFIILAPLNCSSCNCKSEIMILDGKDGQEIMYKSTEYMAIHPIVLHSNIPNAADKFLFTTVMLANKSEAQENKQPAEEAISNDKTNKNQSALLLPGQTNASEQGVWTDIHNYAAGTAGRNLDQQLGLGMTTVAEHDTKTTTRFWNMVLMEFHDGRFSVWEIDLAPIRECHGLYTDDTDIIIEDPNFGLAYFLTIGEIKGTSKVDMINLSTRPSQSSCNKTASAVLHPTPE